MVDLRRKTQGSQRKRLLTNSARADLSPPIPQRDECSTHPKSRFSRQFEFRDCQFRISSGFRFQTIRNWHFAIRNCFAYRQWVKEKWHLRLLFCILGSNNRGEIAYHSLAGPVSCAALPVLVIHLHSQNFLWSIIWSDQSGFSSLL